MWVEEEVRRKYRDWRYALAVGLAGLIMPAIFHWLPPPSHVEFNWGVPLGWGTGSLIWWKLARRGGRKQGSRAGDAGQARGLWRRDRLRSGGGDL